MVYPNRMWPKFLVVIPVILLLLGCAQAAKDTPAPFANAATPDGFSFPHPADVADPNKHGVWVVQSGRTLCLNCHKTDTNTSVPGPMCNSCHALYPHADGWVDQTVHGKYVIDNGPTPCQGCHGSDLAGGLSKVSCTKCHEIYPHPTGWKDSQSAAFHGPTAMGDGKKLCQACHGDDYSGGQSKIACATCHNAPYPHADGWVAKEVHGKYAEDNGTTTCQTCHGDDLAGGISKISCTKCHETYPHAAGWKDPQSANFHGTIAVGDGKNVCKLCHGDTFTGGQNKIVCSDCHAHYPHVDLTAWKSGGASGHTAVVMAEGSTQCQVCHGDNLPGSIFSSFCSDCHVHNGNPTKFATAKFPDGNPDFNPTSCIPCHETGTGLAVTRPVDGIHQGAILLPTQDCSQCHDYKTGAFKILKGETIDFTLSPHDDPTPAPNGVFSGHGSAGCGRCHNKTVDLDYLGVDNGLSFAAVVGGNHTDLVDLKYDDSAGNPKPTFPGPLGCTSCHNSVTASYIDPGVQIYTTSGNLLTVGREGFCVRCHQARTGEGSLKVTAATVGQADDTALAGTYTYAQWPGNSSAGGTVSSATNRNKQIVTHYFPVANIFYGTDGGVGYPYPSKTYVGKNLNMTGYTTCIKCHNPHTTKVNPTNCAACHLNVSSESDFVNISKSGLDYDGDGTVESMHDELEGVKAKLMSAITSYATNVVGTDIAYVPAVPPAATNGWYKSAGGVVSSTLYEPTTTPVTSGKWTPRLLKAAFNYDLVYRDANAYVHNPKYAIELLYDAIENLNVALSDGTKTIDHADHHIDITTMVRPTAP